MSRYQWHRLRQRKDRELQGLREQLASARQLISQLQQHLLEATAGDEEAPFVSVDQPLSPPRDDTGPADDRHVDTATPNLPALAEDMPTVDGDSLDTMAIAETECCPSRNITDNPAPADDTAEAMITTDEAALGLLEDIDASVPAAPAAADLVAATATPTTVAVVVEDDDMKGVLDDIADALDDIPDNSSTPQPVGDVIDSDENTDVLDDSLADDADLTERLSAAEARAEAAEQRAAQAVAKAAAAIEQQMAAENAAGQQAAQQEYLALLGKLDSQYGASFRAEAIDAANETLAEMGFSADCPPPVHVVADRLEIAYLQASRQANNTTMPATRRIAASPETLDAATGGSAGVFSAQGTLEEVVADMKRVGKLR
jgi:hypothetical protein